MPLPRGCTFPRPVSPPSLSSTRRQYIVSFIRSRRRRPRGRINTLIPPNSLPNLGGLALRAIDIEYKRYTIHIPDTFREDTALSQGAQIPWGDPWCDRDGQEPGLVQNWLLVKMCWAHPHLLKRTSGALEQQQNCQVVGDQQVRVRSRRPPGTHTYSRGGSQIPHDSLSYRGQA